MGRTVLILGAGMGGIVAAQTLRKLLPPGERVVVVDRLRTHVFSPSLLWLMTGDREPADFSRPLSAMARKGIEIETGEVTRIDPVALTVGVDDRTLSGDAIIVALGADYAAEAIPGLATAGFNLYTLPGAQGTRDALAGYSGGRIVILTAAPGYKCPAAPYEAAMLIEAACRRRGVRADTRIAIYAAEPMPMPVAGPTVAGQLREILESKGIAYFPEHQVSRVDGGSLHFANGKTEAFDLLCYVPPHRAPTVVREAGLCGESGWIGADRHSLATRFTNVYAIGDVTSIPLEMGRPLPKAGVFAHGEAQVVAKNLARAWTGRGEAARFDGHGMCFVEIGGGMAGVGSGNFYGEPTPDVRLRRPGPHWHLGKILYEKYWLFSRF